MKYLLTPFIQVNDINGKPIAGAKVYVYGSDTTESVITYQNFDGGLNTDPILTDELGNCTVLVDDDCGLCDVYIYDDNDKFIMSKKYITPGVEGGGSSSSTTVAAGYGIIVTQPTGNVYKVSIDTDIIATQDDLENKQDKLIGGDNIEITQQNVVNVTGRKQINTVAPLYTVESDNQIYFGLNTDAFVSSAVLNDYLTTAQYAIDSGAFLTQDALSGYATKSELSSTSGILSGAVDYISAHCGASYPVSAEEAVQYVTNHSATINEVNLTYQANSGSYLTAHQPISSNQWNSNYETVNSNSAKWNDIAVYQNNSANYFTTGDANTISSMFSAAIDYVSANAGQSISGDYELSAGYGITLTDFSADRITRIDVTAGGGGVLPERFVVSADGQAYKMNVATAADEFEDLVTPGYSSLFQLWNMQISDNQSPYDTEYTIYPDTPWSGGSYRISLLSGYDMTNYSATTALTSNKLKLSDYMSKADFDSYLEDCWLVVQPLNMSQSPVNSGISLHYEVSSLNPYVLSSQLEESATYLKRNVSAVCVADDFYGNWSATLERYSDTPAYTRRKPRIITIINNFDAAQVSSESWSADPFTAHCVGDYGGRTYYIPQGTYYTFMLSKDSDSKMYMAYYPVMSGSCSSISNAGGTTFPITSTDGTASFTADMNCSALYLSTAQGAAGLTTKFTGKGVQYQAYPATDISASWYDLIKGANISSLKLSTAQASYSFTNDEIRHLSQINVTTPYTYSGPSTYSVTLGTKTFSNLDSGCYYDFMRAEVEGTETWVKGATGYYSLS